MLKFSLPIIYEPINSFLPQLLPGFVVIIVIAPAEHHQAFGLSLPDVMQVLQQLLSVGTDALEDKRVQHMRKSCQASRNFSFQ